MQNIATLNNTRYVDEEVLTFDIDRPSLVKWIIIILIGLVLNLYWIFVTGYILGPIVLLFILLMSVFTWNKFGYRIVSKSVMRRFDFFNNRYLRNIERRDDVNIRSHPILNFIGWIILNLLGFKLSEHNEYYLEADVNDISINNVTDIFRMRLNDVLSACFGLSMITAFILRFALDSIISINLGVSQLITIIFYLMMISPIFVFFIVPVMWIFEDAQIRTLTKEEGLKSDYLAENIRGGPMGRLLGFSGLVLGLTTLMDIVAETSEYGYMFAYQLTYSLTLLMFYGSSLFGTVYLISAVYLSFYHEKNVNRFRRLISNFIPIGSTVVTISEIPTRENSISSPICNCGKPVDMDASFCIYCGEDVQTDQVETPSCRFCGYQVGANDNFCRGCGREI